MFSSAFLLFGLLVISRYVLAVYAEVNASDTRFETKTANVNEIPYQIILKTLFTDKYFCGGALITSLYVLTAAQCVYKRNISEIIVHAGAITLRENYTSRTRRAVKEIIVHEQYDPRELWRNDIALLQLDAHIVQWKHTRAVALPRTQSTREDTDELARISGYGITSEDQRSSFQRLMKHYTLVVSQEFCQDIYRTIQYNISETQICAFDPHNPRISQKRVSDIGGPLIINGELSGIALSTFPGFPNVTYFPIVFTSVSSYTDWIWNKIFDRMIPEYNEYLTDYDSYDE